MMFQLICDGGGRKGQLESFRAAVGREGSRVPDLHLYGDVCFEYGHDGGEMCPWRGKDGVVL